MLQYILIVLLTEQYDHYLQPANRLHLCHEAMCIIRKQTFLGTSRDCAFTLGILTAEDYLQSVIHAP